MENSGEGAVPQGQPADSDVVVDRDGVHPGVAGSLGRPPSFSPPSRKLPPAAAQKFQMAYHLMFDYEQLQTDGVPALITQSG